MGEHRGAAQGAIVVYALSAHWELGVRGGGRERGGGEGGKEDREGG